MKDLKDTDYQHFNVQERLNLVVAAMSRNDLEEARRLYRTCPKYTYEATDYEFAKRFSGILSVRDKYREFSLYYYHKILIAQNFTAIFTFIEFLNLNHAKTPSALDTQENKNYYIRCLKAIHQAFNEFCEEVGVSAQQLIQWGNEFAEAKAIEEYLAIDGFEPEEEITQYAKNIFFAAWEME